MSEETDYLKLFADLSRLGVTDVTMERRFAQKALMQVVGMSRWVTKARPLDQVKETMRYGTAQIHGVNLMWKDKLK